MEWISAKELFPVIQELLDGGGQAAFTVTGMSMWPFLCHGRDRVIVEACSPRDIRRGDIVLLQTCLGNYLLHRVTKITDTGFETTGDGNCFRDGVFPFACVKARVVCLVRKEKRIACGCWNWRLISRLWMMLFPIRGWLFDGWTVVRRCLQRETA